MIDRRERIEIATIEECKVPFRAKKKRWRNAIKEFLASRPASPRVHWLVVFFCFFFPRKCFDIDGSAALPAFPMSEIGRQIFAGSIFPVTSADRWGRRELDFLLEKKIFERTWFRINLM